MLRLKDGFGEIWNSKFAVYGADNFSDKEKSKNILAQPDKESMHKEIDKLVAYLTENKESFGFFSAEDEIYINTIFMRGFKIDDNEIYYSFFENLKKNLEAGYKYPRASVLSAMKTEEDYFGNVANKEGMKKRNKISQCVIDENEQFNLPSIKVFKGSNAGACVEFASVAHNLFLLAGLKSNFVISKDVKFKNSSDDDGHAFVYIEGRNGQSYLYDMAGKKFEMFDQKKIEDVFNGAPLMFGGDCYANASLNFDKNLQ